MQFQMLFLANNAWIQIIFKILPYAKLLPFRNNFSMIDTFCHFSAHAPHVLLKDIIRKYYGITNKA